MAVFTTFHLFVPILGEINPVQVRFNIIPPPEVHGRVYNIAPFRSYPGRDKSSPGPF